MTTLSYSQINPSMTLSISLLFPFVHQIYCHYLNIKSQGKKQKRLDKTVMQYRNINLKLVLEYIDYDNMKFAHNLTQSYFRFQVIFERYGVIFVRISCIA